LATADTPGDMSNIKGEFYVKCRSTYKSCGFYVNCLLAFRVLANALGFFVLKKYLGRKLALKRDLF
jgi:hypothetical protein